MQRNSIILNYKIINGQAVWLAPFLHIAVYSNKNVLDNIFQNKRKQKKGQRQNGVAFCVFGKATLFVFR